MGCCFNNITDFFRANIEEQKFEIASKTPYVDIEGQFNAEGAVLNFPLVGSGNFWINMCEYKIVRLLKYKYNAYKRSSLLSRYSVTHLVCSG